MPRVRRVPPGAERLATLADEAIALSSGYGLTPDDWQADVLDDWLLVRRSGIYACMTCGLAVPRQNGKNGIIEIRELHGMVMLGEKFLHTAHEVKTARKAFKRLKSFFGERANDPDAKYPELNRLVREVRNTNGQEAIVLHSTDCVRRTENSDRCNCVEADCASVEFVARSKGSGRGFTVDVLVLDEAQALTEDELEALLPTISSAPLGNPQIIAAGTPPNAEKGESGEAFVRIRADGVSGDDPQLAWTDFGAEDGPLDELDLDDRKALYLRNPAMGRRLQESVANTEKRRLSRAGYARERYGWWGDPKQAKANKNFTGGSWADCAVEEGEPPAPGAIGIAVSLDGTHASIAAAGRWDDDRIQVGAVERARGTAWAVARAKAIQDEHGCAVVIDGAGPSAFLAEALEAAGVQVTVTTTSDYADACASLYDLVDARLVTHMEHPELDAAIACAGKRGLGDGRWLWGRKASSGDIAMLEAGTLAAWGVDIEIEAEPSALYV